MNLINRLGWRELFRRLETSSLSSWLLAIAFFCIPFSKSIWLQESAFYFGKFNFFLNSQVSLAVLFLFLGVIVGFLENWKKLKIEFRWWWLLIFFWIGDVLFFSFLALAGFLIYSPKLTKVEKKLIISFFVASCGLQLVLGWYQLIWQSSSGFYWLHFLGEPELDESVKGLAKVQVSFVEFFRAYGTTYHANFFGFLMFLALLSSRFFVGFLGGVLSSFSLTALLGVVIAKIKHGNLFKVITNLLTNRSIRRDKVLLFCLMLLILSKLLSAEYQGVSDRVLQLVNFKDIYFESLSWQKFLLGFDYLDLVLNYKFLPWELQPVHNHFLHILFKYGVVGLSLFGYYCYRLYLRSSWLFYALLPVLLLDHYLITLPNGILLLGLLWVMSSKKVGG